MPAPKRRDNGAGASPSALALVRLLPLSPAMGMEGETLQAERLT